jgi:glycosyltransferase involved in cell wall biosynthesis
VGGFEDVFMNCYVELRKLHQRLDLDGSVRFAGPLPFQQVLDFYRDADVFVLPCVIAEDGSRDIIPNSVLEAMAMGLPVVATTVTGLPEMVEDGRTGFLVQPHDAAALASAMRRLADAPRLRSEFGRAGRLKVEQRFDSERNVAGYRSAFGSLETRPAGWVQGDGTP